MKKRKKFSKEIEYLDKAHELLFNSNKIANLKTLDYWKKIIPKKYNKFIFENLNVDNKLREFKPIFIVGLPGLVQLLLKFYLLEKIKLNL